MAKVGTLKPRLDSKTWGALTRHSQRFSGFCYVRLLKKFFNIVLLKECQFINDHRPTATLFHDLLLPIEEAQLAFTRKLFYS